MRRVDSRPSIAEIAAAIVEAFDQPTQSQRRLFDRLNHQADRLRAAAFQIAVLGQFKRGKSTLLNAFVGYPLLSAGVLPVTAVTTFLAGGPMMQIRLKHRTGTIDEYAASGFEELAAAIAAATTEDQNPHNAKALERVDVSIPCSPWLEDVTLIDTPGIGSTHAHNTDAAHAVLPECDAALFVLSVDPPITEVETEYLSTICRTVSRIIVVLNKVDLVDHADQDKVIAFLSSIISERGARQIDRTIFPVSAKAALAARQCGDDDGLRLSGLPALEEHVRTNLVSQKRIHLEASIARKLSDILIHLEADAALTVRALELPIAALDEKIGVFEVAAAEFVQERDNLQDLLSGEWRRAIAKLDALCDEGEKRARSVLETALAEFALSSNLSGAQATIESTICVSFDREFAAIGDAVDESLNAAVEVHQHRYQELARRVRETAGALMDTSVPAAAHDDWFQIKREPYWVGLARIESLGALTVDGLACLLPKALRYRRQQRTLREAAHTAITRNISGLHWAMRQNIDDSFRRLLSSSTAAIDASIEATREVLMVASGRRRTEGASFQQNVQRARASATRLAELREQLRQHLEDDR